jgi:3-oxoadipate enol-lactonase
MTVSSVRVNDIQVAYRWDGPQGAPVLMMAHAMGTSHRLWDPQIQALTQNYRVLRYDWRGHGDTSAPPGPYTLSQFVDDAAATMDALSLDSAHWVGISTGAMIGQGMAIHHPQRIRSLTLCNTTSQANPWYKSWVVERQAVVQRAGMAQVWEMTKRLWFTDDFVEESGPAYRAVQQVFEATSVAGYLGGTSAVADLAFRDDLHRITAPTHIIAAGADEVTPLEHSLTIQERIKNARLSVIDGQRHFSNVEAAQQFNIVLCEGLSQLIAQ